MNKQDEIIQEIKENGEKYNEYLNFKDNYRTILKNQIIKLHKKLGALPARNKGLVNCMETKVKPQGLHLHSMGYQSQWFCKLNYVGIDAKDEPYIKVFVVRKFKYENAYVKNLKFISDIAKLIDYLKITYNV